MPNWKIHIEIGKRLNSKLKYNEQELNLFLLGTILPDINNSYVVTNIYKKIEHDITHFKNLINPSYEAFYNKYKTEIDSKNPMFIGYLSHLYTDYKWNKYFKEKIEKLNIHTENRDELRIMKQNDFKIYNNKFIKNVIQIDSVDVALKEIQKIDEISIARNDILNVIDFIYNQKEYKGELNFYTIEELDKLLEETVIDLCTLGR